MTRRVATALLIALGVVSYMVFSFGEEVVAPPVPRIILPPDFPTLARERLVKIDDRFARIREIGGVQAVRQAIIQDIASFQKLEEFHMFLIEWIDIAGWDDYADLMVDVAESGTTAVRRNAAALLSSRPTPLLLRNAYGPRIIRLHLSESDPGATADWKDLRAMLGI